jgi:D-alanine-D-alanine ligase
VIVLTSPRLGDRPDLADNAVQADEIAGCLRDLGHAPLVVPFDPGGTLPGDPADPIFNLVEDLAEGTDRIHEATARFEAEGRRYTGARTGALRTLGDKRVMKAMLSAAGLPVADDLCDDDGGVWIVKSATEHASVGLGPENVVTGTQAARAMIARRQGEFGGGWFAEAYIEGREFNLGLLHLNGAPTVLPVAEIRFTDHAGQPKVVGYDAKWIEGSRGYATTRRVFPPAEPALFAELDRLARAAWHLFALEGCARVDLRVDHAGRPVILEVNANPCLARDAGFCAAAERAGLSQTDVVRALLDAAR